MLNKSMKLICSAIIALFLVLTTAPLLAETKQPNAADIYEQIFELYEPIDEIEWFANARYEPNEALTEHIKANSKVIDLFLKASNMPVCQWPEIKPKDLKDLLLSGFRSDSKNISYLIQANARLMLHEGKTSDAMDRCIALFNFSRHSYDKREHTLSLCRGIQEQTCNLIQDALPAICNDTRLLKKIRNKLDDKFLNEPKLTETLIYNKEKFNRFIDSRNFGYLSSDVPAVLELSDEFFERTKLQYLETHLQITKAIQLPHVKALEELEKASELHWKQLDIFFESIPEPKKNITAERFEDNGEIFFVSAAIVFPTLTLNVETGVRTHINALKNALDLALIRAETGKLPAALPPDSGKDLFSGKPFIYEQTDKGFKLHCREKKIKTDKPHYWEFKVKQ